MTITSRVVGIDLSLTGTGIAGVAAGGHEAITITSKPAGQNVLDRSARIALIAGRVVEAARGSVLVVIEGPSLGKASPHTWDRAWLWGSVVDRLIADGFPVAVAPPTVVKKFAAGKGNADKSGVSAGLVRLWGPECVCRNDNEWDALALATMGAQHLGLPGIPERAHHAATLASVAWPLAQEVPA